MGMIRPMRCVGGPWDGEDITSSADLMVLNEYPGMAYHRTLPTDSDWRLAYDHDWFIHGLKEPPPVPDEVWEWHPEPWVSPEVSMIRHAVTRHRERAS
jgi:hypothetical protein